MAHAPVAIIPKTTRASDWKLFTNGGNFNNPLPPSRRLNRNSPYYTRGISADVFRDRSKSARSRNQSAITASTARILSARSITYKRAPRVEPADLDLKEECDPVGIELSIGSHSRRVSTTSSQRAPMWAPQTWSFSHLYRAIIVIDEQARKDFKADRIMHALAAWQNALIYCEQLEQRTNMWPESRAQLDEQIRMLRRAYKQHIDEMNKKNKTAGKHIRFLVPTRECTSCRREQPVDQFSERFSDGCHHVERTICNKCMFNISKALLQSPGSTDLACPEPQCRTVLDSEQVQQVLIATESNESADQQNRRNAQQALERTTAFIWCAHDDCGSGQFHTMGLSASPVVTCILCKRHTCAVHHVKWHRGMTCADYDRQQDEVGKATEQRRKENSKPCPKCQLSLEKTADSVHTVCPKCGFDFCSECLADYRIIQQNGSHSHQTKCSHYQKAAKQKSSSKSSCTIL